MALELNLDEIVRMVEFVGSESLPVSECREIANVVECKCTSDSDAKDDHTDATHSISIHSLPVLGSRKGWF